MNERSRGSRGREGRTREAPREGAARVARAVEEIVLYVLSSAIFAALLLVPLLLVLLL